MPKAQPRAALRLIDFMNPLDFDGGVAMACSALAAAEQSARLKRELRKGHVPAIYCNDNFGRRESGSSSGRRRTCVASERPSLHRAALAHMARVTKADVSPAGLSDHGPGKSTKAAFRSTAKRSTEKRSRA